MSIKTEILDNLKSKIENKKIFKKTIRGLVAIDKVKKTDYPLCSFNAYKTERSDELSGFNRQARNLYIEFFIINKKNLSNTYFKDIDDLEDNVIEFLESLLPDDLHSKCLDVQFLSSEEVVNEEDLDGLSFFKVDILITYFK